MSNRTLIISIVCILVVFGAAVAFFNYRGGKSGFQDQETSADTEQVTDSQLNPARQEQQAAAASGQSGQSASSTASTTAQTALNSCQRDFNQSKFDTMKIATSNRQVSVQVKGYGTIVLALDDTAAPKTVENFLKLAGSGFYDCLTFHRIVPGFVVQGGDPSGDGTGGPGFTVPAEIKLQHKRGSIAMARLGDQVNPNRESSGSQFYIALQDLPQLDGQYTVFGTVVSGMDVVDKIAAVQTNQSGLPATPVVMEKVTISK